MSYRHSLGENALDILCLCKIKIAVFTALSAAAGLFSATYPSASIVAPLMAGVLLMAAGAGALNHCQERQSDALMTRTAGRPLPSGRIKPGFAFLLSLFLLSSGCAVLLYTGSSAASLLGLATVFWYNGFYTRLKTFSGFAAIPGALTGAIPPAIGWIAGGGDILDPRLAVLCFFFFMWQVLHFFLHMHVCGRDYQEAGLPSILSSFTEEQLDRLSLQWLFAAVVSTQFIVLFGLIRWPVLRLAVIGASIWLAFQGMDFIRKSRDAVAGVFGKINYFILFIMLLMILDGLSLFPSRYLMTSIR
jgi:heme o synthase